MSAKPSEDMGFDFIPIKNLLLEDNPEIKKLKTIHKREVEYARILGPIESGIACYYLDNPHITDYDVKQALKKFKDNYDNPLDKDDALLARIQEAASIGLQLKRLTKHELFLVIDYIIWCIDNRSWVPDERAYLNWICNFFDLLSKEEKEKFDLFYDNLGKVYGLTKKEIKRIKLK